MLPPPHGGGTATTNQPNKTSGINKHGTLLSSQTTEAPGTKHNPQGRIIAPEQLFKLTRLSDPMQIRVSGFSSAGSRPHPLQERSKALPEFGLDFGVLAARGNQLFAVSLAAT